MDQTASTTVETVTKTPLNKKVLIGVAVGVIVTGAVALAVKFRNVEEDAQTEEKTEA
jgi:hypothetical protein